MSLLLVGRMVYAQADQAVSYPAFIKGADLSMLEALQDRGVQYRENGQVKDPLVIFRDYGCNYVRLRIFVNPDGTHGQVNSLAYTLGLAERAKKMGFGFLLDFHYSDKWADPGKQFMPDEWKNLTHAQLTDRVYTYTKETLAAFQQAGCMPDMVQVGNEITNGMIWPDGGSLKDKTKWDAFADLLKAGIKAVRESGPMKVVIHVDRGGTVEVSKWFFDNLAKRDVQFDVIGLSFYPFDNGSLDDLAGNLDFLSKTYGKDIIVAETGYFAAGGSAGKNPFPTTPQGQKEFMDGLMRTVAATPGGRGRGVFYWAPEWIRGAGYKGSGPKSNRALFDENGNAFPAMEAFGFEPGAGKSEGN
jgi:arabinogalactan endo-1,4-beta-galactosidase